MTRFLCTGDLHLGAGGDYGREPGERLAEQAAVWARIVGRALDLGVDALLFAGDAFERRRPTPEEMRAFEQPLIVARQNDLPVIAIPGNHDVEHADRATGLDVLADAGLLSLDRLPRIHGSVGNVNVATLPWTPVSRLVAAEAGGDRDDLHAQAAALLVQTARGLRDRIDGPAVLMLHFSITGAVTPDGADVGMFREVVLPADELAALGFDAIVAAHIHRPQPVAGGFYVGSPMPLSFGEAKSDHGCYLLDVTAEGARSFFLPVESRRFVTIDAELVGRDLPVDAQSALLEVLDAEAIAAGGLNGAVVKVRYTATAEQARRVDQAAIRRALLDAGAHRVWQIKAEIQRPERAAGEQLDETLDELAAFQAYLRSINVNGDRGDALADLTRDYLDEARR